jgi:hypothetical protein
MTRDITSATFKDIALQLPVSLQGVAAENRELWWMNKEWLEFRWRRTIDQKLAAVCTDQCFGEACCLHHMGGRPYDGGNKHLWNVGKFFTKPQDATSLKTVIFTVRSSQMLATPSLLLLSKERKPKRCDTWSKASNCTVTLWRHSIGDIPVNGTGWLSWKGRQLQLIILRYWMAEPFHVDHLIDGVK